jgi:hypothetical protein
MLDGIGRARAATHGVDEGRSSMKSAHPTDVNG